MSGHGPLRFSHATPVHDAGSKAGGASVELDRAQANYLLNVLRLKEGDGVLLFNGRDGEWLANVAPAGRKSAALASRGKPGHSPLPSDLHLLLRPA